MRVTRKRYKRRECVLNSRMSRVNARHAVVARSHEKPQSKDTQILLQASFIKNILKCVGFNGLIIIVKPVWAKYRCSIWLTLFSLSKLMHGSILPVTFPPPGHTPGDLQFCSPLAVYFPPPDMEKETISNPRDSSSTTNTLVRVQDIDYDIDFRTIAKADVLTRT